VSIASACCSTQDQPKSARSVSFRNRSQRCYSNEVVAVLVLQLWPLWSFREDLEYLSVIAIRSQMLNCVLVQSKPCVPLISNWNQFVTLKRVKHQINEGWVNLVMFLAVLGDSGKWSFAQNLFLSEVSLLFWICFLPKVLAFVSGIRNHNPPLPSRVLQCQTSAFCLGLAIRGNPPPPHPPPLTHTHTHTRRCQPGGVGAKSTKRTFLSS
jgi:hypothetical protein